MRISLPISFEQTSSKVRSKKTRSAKTRQSESKEQIPKRLRVQNTRIKHDLEIIVRGIIFKVWKSAFLGKASQFIQGLSSSVLAFILELQSIEQERCNMYSDAGVKIRSFIEKPAEDTPRKHLKILQSGGPQLFLDWRQENNLTFRLSWAKARPSDSKSCFESWF